MAGILGSDSDEEEVDVPARYGQILVQPRFPGANASSQA